MIHHLVMLKFKPETTSEQIAALEQTLGGLNAQQQFLSGFQFPTIG